MKAVCGQSPGGPEVLELRDVPAPVPGPGEVLIDVVAAGINRADVQQRQGHYPPPPGASEIPGLEVSGRIAGFGPGVSQGRSPRGKRWWRCSPAAAMPSRWRSRRSRCCGSPRALTWSPPRRLPEVAATVYSNLFMTAQLQAGETVLIHGGTGGIGAMAVQLAKAFGATVAATAATTEKVEHALRLPRRGHRHQLHRGGLRGGSAQTHRRPRARTSSWTSSAPNTSSATLRRWPMYGRLVVIGLQGGTTAELNLGQPWWPSGRPSSAPRSGPGRWRRRARSWRRSVSTSGRC